MRVVHVNRFAWRYAGAEAYMFDLADLQRQSGHEAEIFGMRHPNNPRSALAEYFPEFIDLRGIWGPPTPRARSAPRALWSRASYRGLRAAIRYYRPDVIHYHMINNELSPSVLWSAKHEQVPCVMTLHNYKWACPSQDMLNHGQICDACFKGGFRQAAQKKCKDDSRTASGFLTVEAYLHQILRSRDIPAVLICPSIFLKQQMTRAGLPEGRLRVIPNFVLRESLITTTDTYRTHFSYVGRLSSVKGVHTLIRALALVPDARLVVAGIGPEARQLQELAERLVPGRVSFVGQLNRPSISDLLATSTAATLPAVWNENQPMSILEAAAARVPVVASRIGGIPELIEHGHTGLLHQPGDVADIADQLAYAIRHSGSLRQMGARAHERLRRRHAPEPHLAAILAAYVDAGAG